MGLTCLRRRISSTSSRSSMCRWLLRSRLTCEVCPARFLLANMQPTPIPLILPDKIPVPPWFIVHSLALSVTVRLSHPHLTLPSQLASFRSANTAGSPLVDFLSGQPPLASHSKMVRSWFVLGSTPPKASRLGLVSYLSH